MLPSLSIWARSVSFPAGDSAACALHTSAAHLAALAKLQLACRAASAAEFVRLARAAKRSVKRGLASIAEYFDAEAEVERLERQARELGTADAGGSVALQQQVAEADARMQGAKAVAVQVARAARLQAEGAEVRGAFVALRKCHAQHARQVSELLLEAKREQAGARYRPSDAGGLLEAKVAYSALPPTAIAATHRLQQLTAAEGWLNAAISHCAAAKRRVVAFAQQGLYTVHGPEGEGALLEDIAAALADPEVATLARSTICSPLEVQQSELALRGCTPLEQALDAFLREARVELASAREGERNSLHANAIRA